jgi:N-acetylmuramoyl-L-alanine amidase
MLANPPRLVLDLDNTRLVSKRNLNLHSAEVQSVRAGIRAGVDLRIVADLQQAFAYESQLRSVPGNGGRQLVVDIVRSKGASAAKQRSVNYGVVPTASARRDIVIAIDAGHGGKDPGAIGPNGTREKVVVLQIARRLRDLVNQVPGMRGVLTRDSDTYLPLRKRIQIARRHQADMFVSIHADAYTNPDAHRSNGGLSSDTSGCTK